MAESNEKSPAIEKTCPAYTGNKPFIIVSYAFQDRAVVFPELQRLHALGYRFWYDEGVALGEAWLKYVQKAVEFSGCFLVFISNNAIRSPNVRDEIEFGRNNINQLFAIYIEKTDLPQGEELRLSRFTKIQKHGRPDEEYFKEIARQIPPEYRRNPFETENTSFESGAGEVPSHYRNFEDLLSSIAPVIPPLNETNILAKQFERKNRMYRYLAYGSCWCAVVFGILQVFFSSVIPEWFLVIEILAIILAIVSVIIGVSSRSYNRWIMERIRTERFQFLMFRQLIDPVPVSEFNEKRNSIQKMNKDDLIDWLYGVTATYGGSGIFSCKSPQFTPQITCKIIHYYCENRISDELDNTPDNYASKVTKIKIIFMLPTFAFLGFILISLPYLLDFFSVTSRGEAISIGITYIGYCIVFVILYASIWATIRGFFGDEESARQMQSAIARKREFLLKSQRELEHQNISLCNQNEKPDEKGQDQLNLTIAQVMQTMYYCEDAIENDCRSWLHNKCEKRYFG